MKNSFIFLLFVSSVITAKAQVKVSDNQAVQMLRSFYTAYITTIASSANDLTTIEKKCELLKEEYCTKKLLKNIPRLTERSDADPIINAQDARMDCVKTLTFKEIPNKPNSYIVSYYYMDDYTKKRETTTINLAVVNQNGHFKIDSIW